MVSDVRGTAPASERAFRSGDLAGALLAVSSDAALVVDEQGTVVLASTAVERLFGYRPDELVGQPVEVLVPEDLRSAHVRHREAFALQRVPRTMGLGLQLTGRRQDGETFPIDVSLTPISDGGEHFVGAFVRDATERRRHEARQQASIEITQHLLAGHPSYATLELIARRARGLAGAEVGWIVRHHAGGGLDIVAADGRGASSIIGVHIPVETSLSRRAMNRELPVLVEDLSSDPAVPPEVRAIGLGPAMFVPLLGDGRNLGVLVVGRASGSGQFTERSVAQIEVFAATAAVALALGEARSDLERFQVAAEQDRIARDLHDTVIQRLFALGMSLQGVHRLADGLVAERIEQVVDGLDEVIREIRETIFHLQRPAAAGAGLRDLVVAITERAARQLGFAPRVGFQGPVDTVTSDELQEQVTAVLTEALSNVARHAKATGVQVVIVAEGGWLSLSVADDGIGPAEGPTAGNGLRNLTERARQLAGQATFAARQPSGSLLEWRVPIDR